MNDIRQAIKETDRYAVVFYLAFAGQVTFGLLMFTASWAYAIPTFAMCVAQAWVMPHLWHGNEESFRGGRPDVPPELDPDMSPPSRKEWSDFRRELERERSL